MPSTSHQLPTSRHTACRRAGNHGTGDHSAAGYRTPRQHHTCGHGEPAGNHTGPDGSTRPGRELSAPPSGKPPDSATSKPSPTAHHAPAEKLADIFGMSERWDRYHIRAARRTLTTIATDGGTVLIGHPE